MLITDREYLSGVISVVNHDNFSENTLKQVIKIVDKVMLKHCLRDEWVKLLSSYRVSGKYVESGVNQDDLYTSDFSKSDSARFNMFTRPGFDGRYHDILSDIEWELNRFVDLEEFDGVQLNFDYNIVSFDEHGDIDAYRCHDIYEYMLVDKRSDALVCGELKNYTEPLWEELTTYSVRKYTDLILVTGDFDGAYQLIAEVIHREQTNTWTVNDKLNQTSQQFADIVMEMTDKQTTDMNYLKKEKEEFLVAVKDVIYDTLGTDYVIGQKGLIDYFNKISKVLLEKMLTGEIKLN